MFTLFVVGALVNGLLGLAFQDPRVDSRQQELAVHRSWQSLPRLPDPSENCVAWTDDSRFWLVECDKEHSTPLNEYVPPLDDTRLMEEWTRFWLMFFKLKETILDVGIATGLPASKARAYASRYREAYQKLVEEGGMYVNFTLQAIKTVSDNLARFACAHDDFACHLELHNTESKDEIIVPIVARKLPLHFDYIKKNFKDYQ